MRLVSFDIGNGYVKWTRGGEDHGYFPSVYCLEEPGIDFAGLAAVDDLVITFEGQRYAIGWSARRLGNIPVRTLDRSRILGSGYRILFAAALAQSNGRGGLIAPILSLPVRWYQKRDQVKAHIAGSYQVYHAGIEKNFEVPLDNIRIIPEGFGSICSIALDRNGRLRANGLHNMTVGVVDVGTKTTDLIMFESLQLVPAKTQGYDVGLEGVYNIMERLADQEYGHSYSIEQLDDAINGLPLWFGRHDISDEALEWKHVALKQIADSIVGHINTLWQSGQDVQQLLLTGGGAQHIYPYLLEHFPDHLQPVEHGPMANVTGAYQYGMLRSERPS